MSEMKWTPGPWHARNNQDNEVTVRDASGDYLCVAQRPDLSEADKANAHLMAAAPDLYEALDWCLKNFDPNITMNTTPEQFEACLEKVRAALAKARGEQT